MEMLAHPLEVALLLLTGGHVPFNCANDPSSSQGKAKGTGTCPLRGGAGPGGPFSQPPPGQGPSQSPGRGFGRWGWGGVGWGRGSRVEDDQEGARQQHVQQRQGPLQLGLLAPHVVAHLGAHVLPAGVEAQQRRLLLFLPEAGCSPSRLPPPPGPFLSAFLEFLFPRNKVRFPPISHLPVTLTNYSSMRSVSIHTAMPLAARPSLSVASLPGTPLMSGPRAGPRTCGSCGFLLLHTLLHPGLLPCICLSGHASHWAGPPSQSQVQAPHRPSLFLSWHPAPMLFPSCTLPTTSDLFPPRPPHHLPYLRSSHLCPPPTPYPPPPFQNAPASYLEVNGG